MVEKNKKVLVFLGIGSNLGNRHKNIIIALYLLKETPGIRIKKMSRLYETVPEGGPRQRNFINGAIRIETSLSPLKLLERLKHIERLLGRKKTLKDWPRPIDLDILLYGTLVLNNKKLKIPHPRMFEREFVLKPLREII